jgi:hypothetical protein
MKKQIWVALAVISATLCTHAYASNKNVGDLEDQSDPALEAVDAEWFDNDISVMNPPDKMSLDEQNECIGKILIYVNNTFQTEFTKDNVMPVQLPSWEKAETGFVRGGGFNIRIVGEAPANDNPVRYGRYMPWIGWIELGAHPALHLPGSIAGYQTFTRQPIADNTSNKVDFVAHIDTALPYEPVGAIIHLFRDVIGASGRNPCPGDE